MVLFDFSNVNLGHRVCIDGEIFPFPKIIENAVSNTSSIFEAIINNESSEIFVVNYPGSYTGIRKSISILKAFEFLKIKNIYSINLIRDFGGLFSSKVFFKENHIIHFFNRDNGESITLNPISKLDYFLENALGNIPNNNGEYINFDILEIYNNLPKIPRIPMHQEYFDFFALN